jgi:hypothetical protein
MSNQSTVQEEQRRRTTLSTSQLSPKREKERNRYIRKATKGRKRTYSSQIGGKHGTGMSH